MARPNGSSRSCSTPRPSSTSSRVPRGALGDRRQQRGLADPGLADHAEHVRAAAAHVVERAGREVEFAVAVGELHSRS